MKQLLSCRNVVVISLLAMAFLGLQICLWMHTASAKTRTLEYLGRGVFSESQMAREQNFYPNGKDRWTFQIPPFNEKFRMHTASFEWNENRYVPPDANTKARDTWVGTCTLTPKTPWRYIDIFGILGPVECSVYGDWHVESKH